MLLPFKGDVKCSLTNSFETKTSVFTEEFRAADTIFSFFDWVTKHLYVLNSLIVSQGFFWNFFSLKPFVYNFKINNFLLAKWLSTSSKNLSHFIWSYQVRSPSLSYHLRLLGTKSGTYFIATFIFFYYYIIAFPPNGWNKKWGIDQFEIWLFQANRKKLVYFFFKLLVTPKRSKWLI